MSSLLNELSDPGSSQAQAADLIVAYLLQLEIEYIFGVPGGAIEPLYNALARSARRGGPRAVLARHEAGAAFMADGYARETGKVGVCCATSGPGATNLLTGVACAYDNGVPVLAITGQPPLPAFGRRALQESACTGINTLSMYRHCTRYNSLVSHPEQMEHKLVAALQHTMRPQRGPVHLTIPVDILRSPIPSAEPTHNLRSRLLPRALLDQDAYTHLRELLDQARKPVLLIGGGCGEAAHVIVEFAERRQIPFVTTPDGKGLVDPHHSLNCGVFGFAGHVTADALLRDPHVDLVLAVGSSMNEWTSSGWSDHLLNEKLVHIDSMEDHLLRTPMARLQVRGRILTVFAKLLTHLGQGSAPLPRWEAVVDGERWLSPLDRLAINIDEAPLKPQRLMKELAHRLPPGTRYLADAGNSVAWCVHFLSPSSQDQEQRQIASRPVDSMCRNHGGWLRLTMDFAPMGWAIGGAVGTAMGCADTPVVCITGDGSMLMNGQEISAALAEGLNVIYVVLNDGALGMVKHGQRLAGAEPTAFELPPTDFAAMAKAMGVEAYTIRSAADFDVLDLAQAGQRRKPLLLDVHIDPEAVPPMNLRMRVLGTVQ
ncbi:MAG TPA: thiamine pyrophosphate-binding protein [Rhodocyclaceae bacterium]|nr:thiamine pyrophosphate-binding protein [Rhodocyclaceae bacterium]